MLNIKKLLIAVKCLLLTACVVQPEPRPGDPRYAPVVGPNTAPPPTTDGSLYQEGFGLSLFNDRKAHRVGDILTIILNERTVSSKSSAVTVDKESSVNIAEDAAGTAGTLLGTRPSFKNLSLLTDVGGTREFAGEADADQSNNLQGSISVTVSDVLPNGNLMVRGEKWMTLNRGDEFIRISGIIRPEDVSTENSILSTQLANAHISYSGTGALADSSTMGWLGRFFNSPYWPF